MRNVILFRSWGGGGCREGGEGRGGEGGRDIRNSDVPFLNFLSRNFLFHSVLRLL